ncbi:tail tape measure protein [Novosphingobium mangrovi (ex Huang et al. 2023)]|uniref:Tail tape measure protein n=1 Tax=Novosphingobium mangrovi (ex Huang et al. 2023) TaxID=2976432 RepID=A0ABT2I319_9SPHN|nr:tail tape measure protein [Novosphingobium mangrovi (ex Huang et al. 2023)]MCT2399199.1 tail tape measure protein [Novosphingobium mangrovi (ex Huang et al. 2023)]
MTDEIDSLLVDVRASTEGFARDIAAMRGAVDGDLVSGFTKAGNALEKGLASAIRSGSLGFDDLKRVALSTLDEIAAQAAQTLVSAIGGSTPGGGLFDFAGLFSSVLGLPGRATGGNVSPGRGYIVGERGPELFVPTSAGRVEAGTAPVSRDVRVAINVTAPRTSSTPQSLRRSTRQVASAVRRALTSG